MFYIMIHLCYWSAVLSDLVNFPISWDLWLTSLSLLNSEFEFCNKPAWSCTILFLHSNGTITNIAFGIKMYYSGTVPIFCGVKYL